MRGEVKGLSAWKDWLEDKAAGRSACTSLGPDPVGATGWGCLERLQEEEKEHFLSADLVQKYICILTMYPT